MKFFKKTKLDILLERIEQCYKAGKLDVYCSCGYICYDNNNVKWCQATKYNLDKFSLSIYENGELILNANLRKYSVRTQAKFSEYLYKYPNDFEKLDINKLPTF